MIVRLTVPESEHERPPQALARGGYRLNVTSFLPGNLEEKNVSSGFGEKTSQNTEAIGLRNTPDRVTPHETFSSLTGSF